MADRFSILDMMVAGDPGKAKKNFINSILRHHPSSAEVHRKDVTIHYIYNSRDDLRIQIHDVSKKEQIDHDFYEKMAVIVFCYAADDPESLQSLEKWFGLLRSQIGKKETISFLVGDSSNVGFPGDVSQCLAEEANKLKETYGIEGLIEWPFEDEKRSSNALRTILRDVSPPKPSKKPKKVSESPKTCLQRKFLTTSPKQYIGNLAEDLEKLNFFSRTCLEEQLFY